MTQQQKNINFYHYLGSVEVGQFAIDEEPRGLILPYIHGNFQNVLRASTLTESTALLKNLMPTNFPSQKIIDPPFVEGIKSTCEEFWSTQLHRFGTQTGSSFDLDYVCSILTNAETFLLVIYKFDKPHIPEIVESIRFWRGNLMMQHFRSWYHDLDAVTRENVCKHLCNHFQRAFAHYVRYAMSEATDKTTIELNLPERNNTSMHDSWSKKDDSLTRLFNNGSYRHKFVRPTAFPA